jgi:hypothetical protein
LNLQETKTALNQAGIALYVKDNRLNCKTKKGAMPTELVAAIREHKEALLNEIIAGIDGPAMLDSLKSEGWSSEMAELVAWCWLGDLPNKPFYLSSGRKIADIKQFFRDLGMMLNAGPKSKIAQNGELKKLILELQSIAIEQEAR